MKKILAFILLIMISTITLVFHTVAYAENNKTSLVNIIDGGDFESGIPSNVVYINKTNDWYGKLEIAQDPFDASNSVLKVYDSSTTEGTGFLVDRISTSGKKWYIEADVLLVSDSKANVNFSDDGGWYDYQKWQDTGLFAAVSTKVSANNTQWKSLAATLEDDGDDNNKVWFFAKGKIPFFVDNLTIYDMTNAYEIGVTEGVTIDADSYTVVGGKNMANAGDTVKFTIDAPMGYSVKTVTVNGVVATAVDKNTFTFVMPSAGATIEYTTEKRSHITSLVNVVEGGDMENGIPSAITFQSWYGMGSIVTDPFDESNDVLYVSRADSTAAGTAIMFKDISTIGKRWTINARVLNGAQEYTDIFFTDQFGWFDYQTQVSTGNYVTVSNKVYASGTQWSYLSTTVSDDGDSDLNLWLWIRKGSKPFYADDIRIYDVTNAYSITASDDVTIDPASYAVIDNKKMANAGDCVRITAPEGYIVYMNGEQLVADERGVFLIDMPENSVNITAEEVSLVNLIENGDFSDGTVGEFYAGFGAESGHYVSVEDGALKFTAENELEDGVTPLVIYPYNVTAGERYFFSYKARKGDGMNAAEMYTGTKTGGDFSNYQPLSEDGTFNQYYTEFIPSADGTDIRFFPKAVDGVYSGGTYYLDDVELYNVTSVAKLSFDTAADIEITCGIDTQNNKKVILDPVNNVVYAEKGAVISFTVINPDESKTISVTGENVEQISENTYRCTAGYADKIISVAYVSDVRIQSVNYLTKKVVISSDKDLECVVVAATFNSNGRTIKAIPIDVTVEANGTATVDLSAFYEIKGVTLFIWNNLTDIDPVIESYVIP